MRSGARGYIHDGEERRGFIHGPDTEAQDNRLQIIKSSLQRTAGPNGCAETGNTQRELM
jgi:hypothetical protein